MKQIIVHVGDLTNDEKQRVNEALAKLVNASKIEKVTTDMAWFYAPSSLGMQVGWNSIYKSGTPTHTSQRVLEMAEMLNKGHVHAELMAQYAEDAKTHAEPWELWQYLDLGNEWTDIRRTPQWGTAVKYRRRPITKLIHGVEVPDISFTPKPNEEYFYPNPTVGSVCTQTPFVNASPTDHFRLKHNLCYPPTDEGREAAILHAKAMLGIAT